MIIGVADSMSVKIDGVEVLVTKDGVCGAAVDREVSLEAGAHTYDVVYANDGTHTNVGLLYSGPDTNSEFVRFADGNLVHGDCLPYTPSPYYEPSPYYIP